jgi:hypothetical protein
LSVRSTPAAAARIKGASRIPNRGRVIVDAATGLRHSRAPKRVHVEGESFERECHTVHVPVSCMNTANSARGRFWAAPNACSRATATVVLTQPNWLNRQRKPYLPGFSRDAARCKSTASSHPLRKCRAQSAVHPKDLDWSRTTRSRRIKARPPPGPRPLI